MIRKLIKLLNKLDNYIQYLTQKLKGINPICLYKFNKVLIATVTEFALEDIKQKKKIASLERRLAKATKKPTKRRTK